MKTNKEGEKKRTVSVGLFHPNVVEKEIIYITLTDKTIDRDIEILVEATSSLEFDYKKRDPDGAYVVRRGVEADNTEKVGQALYDNYPNYIGFISNLVELNNATLDHTRLYIESVKLKSLELETLNKVTRLIKGMH